MATITIRSATGADRDSLGRLGGLLVELHHGFDPMRFIAPNPGTPKAYGGFLAGESERPDAVVLVAEKSGAVVGYAYGGIEGTDFMALRGPAGILYDLLVDPDHRREGIGRALVESVIAALLERGAPRVILSTAYRNEAAKRLFASAGFRSTMIEMTREGG